MTGYRLEYRILNESDIYMYIIFKNGYRQEVARIACPKDGQIQDNLVLANELKHSFNKRMRKSLWGEV